MLTRECGTTERVFYFHLAGRDPVTQPPEDQLFKYAYLLVYYTNNK